MNRTAHLLLLALLPLGCTAPVGVARSGMQVPTDGLAQCDSQCGVMGLKTSAVVAMAGRIGCVCEPKGTSAQRSEDSAAVAGGMATIIAQEQAEQRQQQQRQMQAR